VVAAFRAVPRHRFVATFHATDPDDGVSTWSLDPARPDPRALALAYDSSRALALNASGTSTISAPDVVAAMLDALGLAPGQRVLEIGTGSGFNAALMAALVAPGGAVVTIDIDDEIVAGARRALADVGVTGVEVIAADGADGAPAHAPYHRVVATVGCADVAPAWIEQLAPDGRLLVPLEHGGWHPVVRFVLADEGALVGRVVTPASFVRVAGALDRPLPWVTGSAARRARRATGSRPLPRRLRGTWAGHHRLYDVAFHVALVDHRSARLAALDDGAGSWAVLAPSAAAVSWDGPQGSDLASDLVSAATDWVDRGAPAIGAYEIRMAPRRDEVAAGTGWVVERPHHRQAVRLA
jgi:protein-L-isoaspartate(D-aspartate) O-methyltransferase